jgi:hypothetical protein
MKLMLNQVPCIDEITHVVIENQISPIATRMKTIQGMLAQYFIMKNDNIVVEFVSSANKLKQFTHLNIYNGTPLDVKGPQLPINQLKGNPPTEEGSISNVHRCNGILSAAAESTSTEGRTNPHYKEHKKDGVFYCSELLKSNPTLHAWSESLNTKKKDDLADCFLQGIWYLKHHNILLYAEDLKIKIVALS